MLEHITPLILTYNEAPNIARTLERLQWAQSIVIVDSFSTDDTLRLAGAFPQVRIFQRAFDSHRDQWNYGLKETGIKTDWVLALDADYVLTEDFIEELKRLDLENHESGYVARFVYCIEGRALRGSAYPPVTVLYRRDKAAYLQDGHTQRISVDGELGHLNSVILHDDRKPLGHWLQHQQRYAQLEAAKILQSDWKNLSWPDRIRRMRVLAPFLMAFYCLFIKGALFDGWAGWYYTFQRVLAEILLALHLLQPRLHQVEEPEPEETEANQGKAFHYQQGS